ncbi:hypothetical protein SARC_04292 [Sphaeroforma arctica JP610]|uniref:ACT domain-containing protein n=1 Tax=Sphaeroforma arctica JP610 TaxID=667725 RepID=A0A0L0G3N6_9EUKA|nr:hypothetical protein SARC_04292 [Sphaeroforma arctica JP610]KNC83451.1 hypothetical protein SARC_04292 [Sphaeroforma arctica JP610]|eukprot:XP_014157353.1 hypothetical protein SARC_04292 [Sphaeroforma arctica JP610]
MHRSRTNMLYNSFLIFVTKTNTHSIQASRIVMLKFLTSKRFISANPCIVGSSICRRSYTAINGEPSAKSRSLVVTISGTDHIGIVAALTKRLTEFDGCVLKSKMARLAGEFAVIAHVDLNKPYNTGLLTALNTDLPNYAVSIRSASPQPPPIDGERRRSYMCTFEGPNEATTLTEISATFASLNCNIDDLDSDVVHAPFAGYKVLKARAYISFSEEHTASVKSGLYGLMDTHTMHVSLKDVTDSVSDTLELTHSLS